jgi:serine/threonine-protein kinase HipA
LTSPPPQNHKATARSTRNDIDPQFLDNPDQVHSSRQRTPPGFSNLLPEGPLRELIARQAGVSVYREFFLLQHLGEDLPGAVRIVAAEAFPETSGATLPATDKHPRADDWHFSLAGVQLKFSARREGRGMTIPVSGIGVSVQRPHLWRRRITLDC